MSLNSLLAILPLPQSPVEVPTTETWNATEMQLGRLPEDYKSFVDRFGTGSVSGFLWILNPGSQNRHLNLLREKEPILSALRELRESGELCPYPLHPEPGGLLPFGKSDNGDALYWLTTGEPERWPIVVNAARDPAYERFECDMTDFLAGILTQRIRCSIFPGGFPRGSPTFSTKPSSQ
jgi:hypothetical protein